uniref:Uncharacterized protein n=1 Tax=Glossina palpalis gambiensis TaxID=67801 RepID=A0A1B0B808_9MUSC
MQNGPKRISLQYVTKSLMGPSYVRPHIRRPFIWTVRLEWTARQSYHPLEGIAQKSAAYAALLAPIKGNGFFTFANTYQKNNYFDGKRFCVTFAFFWEAVIAMALHFEINKRNIEKYCIRDVTYLLSGHYNNK